MSRSIERGSPWPSTPERKKPLRLEKFLSDSGVNLDSSIPHDDLNIIRRFFRLRQLVNIGIMDPIVAAKRFSRVLEKKDIDEGYFCDKYSGIFRVITLKTSWPPKFRP